MAEEENIMENENNRIGLVLGRAYELAHSFEHEYVTLEHILAVLLEEDDITELMNGIQIDHAAVAVAIIAVAAIVGITIFYVNDRVLMSKNIDSAIAKGMDPISVRCSYVTNTDTICVAYAASTSKK